MSLSMKQKQTHRQESSLVTTKGERSGSLGLQMQTITRRMDKQQGSTMQHRQPQSTSYNKP